MTVLRKIAAFLRSIAIALFFALIVGLLFWVSLQLNPPRELALIAVLVITMGTVIIAAFITAMIHRVVGPASSSSATGLVFRESIKRYAWLAAPIAGGYGIADIVRTVAEIIVQSQ